MKEGLRKLQERNAEHARKELSDFLSEFSGTSRDALVKVVGILTKHRAYKYFCEQSDLNYDSMVDIANRKNGCQLAGFDDLLSAIGYELRLVKKE